LSLLQRIQRHRRLSREATDGGRLATPPFLILFINSICNLACDHCFYWKELNSRDDLSKDEIFDLARSLGPIENLNLSGGEPFIRPEYGEICRFFIRQNGVKKIYCPTNGWFTEKTKKQLEIIFEDPALELFAVELSLDGMPEFHDEFRKQPRSFAKAMETYDMLAELKKTEPRLEIHAISTATGENLDEIKRLTTLLFERCPAMNHHNIAMLRGERKRPTLVGPQLEQYRELIRYVNGLWREREDGRSGGIVDPMLHWGKLRIAAAQSQAIPCCAGKLTGVVYANGDVSVCEQREPLGNIRQKPFPEIWSSPEAEAVRASIRAKECFCTNEIFLWPSIVFQPAELAKAYVGAKAWRAPELLKPGERVDPWDGGAPTI
jgi:MoaA/NifB/PqqE/SkfB family radical SAM enzyme